MRTFEKMQDMYKYVEAYLGEKVHVEETDLDYEFRFVPSTGKSYFAALERLPEPEPTEFIVTINKSPDSLTTDVTQYEIIDAYNKGMIPKIKRISTYSNGDVHTSVKDAGWEVEEVVRTDDSYMRYYIRSLLPDETVDSSHTYSHSFHYVETSTFNTTVRVGVNTIDLNRHT